ncbi:MAG: NINE protein [Pirellulaceae bacterium]|nr:NINE protein [Pirellulaceae bacterium]
MDNPFSPQPMPPGGGQSGQIDVRCPFCQTPVSLPAMYAGSAVDCPHCKGKFQAPMPTGFGMGQPGYQNPAVREFASKKIAAGICGILLGPLGIHKFVLGFNGAGAIMLAVSLVGIITGSCLVIPLLAYFAMAIIGLVEGIMYLTKTDEEFYQLYAIQRKEWF